MSGRKCHVCQKNRVGYCPFDEACRYEVWESFVIANKKAIALEKLELAQHYESGESED
jgi:hypothetical protein